MPSITDKLVLEENNEHTVILWPEGSFYKAYERSAYLFVTRLRPYMVRRMFVESVSRDVVSIGFPQTVLQSLEPKAEIGSDGVARIRLDGAPDMQQFLQWRDSQPMSAQTKTKQAAPQSAVPAVGGPSAEAFVADRIRRLDLSAMTPMDCMMLLAELKKQLQTRGDGQS